MDISETQTNIIDTYIQTYTLTHLMYPQQTFRRFLWPTTVNSSLGVQFSLLHVYLSLSHHSLISETKEDHSELGSFVKYLMGIGKKKIEFRKQFL